MNQEHFKAILDSNGPALVAKCGNRIVASDGRIAAGADYPISGKQEAIEKFAARWAAWSESEWEQIEPTEEVHKYHGIFVRVMGDIATVQEAFYRTFAGPKAAWHWSGNLKEPFLVKENGQLIGVVMATAISPNELSYPLADPADAEAFELFATEKNGYYLQGDRGLLREIADLRQEIEGLEKQIAGLEDELYAAQDELASKLAALEANKGKVA